MTRDDATKQMIEFVKRFSDVCIMSKARGNGWAVRGDGWWLLAYEVGYNDDHESLFYWTCDRGWVETNDTSNLATNGVSVWEVKNILGDDDAAVIYGTPYSCPSGCDGNECDRPCPSSEPEKPKKKEIPEFPHECPLCRCAAYVSPIPGGAIECSSSRCKYYKDRS